MADRIIGNQMAYVGETPWHGKGIPADLAKLATMTEEEKVQYWLTISSTNWEVQRRMLAMRDAIGSKDVLLTEPLAGFRAIVRADTNEVYQVATNRYHPLQNRQIVEFFMNYCEAGHATMETLGAIDGGRKIFALAKLNGGTHSYVGSRQIVGTVTQKQIDELNGYMLLATSHDGSLQTVGKPTQVRVVCHNTLSLALNLAGDGSRLGKKDQGEFRMRHSRKWTPEVAEEAKRVMGMAIESVQAMNETAQRLAKVSIDDRGRMEFIKRLLGGETILEQVTANTNGNARMDATATQRAGGSYSILDSVVDNHTTAKSDEPTDLNRAGKAILEAMLTSPGSDLLTAKNTLWGAVNGVSYYVDHQRGRTQDTRLSNAWFGQGDTMKQQAVKVAMDFVEGRV